jgi:hypothetical protein
MVEIRVLGEDPAEVQRWYNLVYQLAASQAEQVMRRQIRQGRKGDYLGYVRAGKPCRQKEEG